MFRENSKGGGLDLLGGRQTPQRHRRVHPGDPWRLMRGTNGAWMPGTSPGMTGRVHQASFDELRMRAQRNASAPQWCIALDFVHSSLLVI